MVSFFDNCCCFLKEQHMLYGNEKNERIYCTFNNQSIGLENTANCSFHKNIEIFGQLVTF